ncbi:MAG: 4Fe-4S dicluster domain-containing protein [Anaerolineales bacterium]|nr:4Fe-4S dicluster domain-containing protein [Anaerolineales bacterium]MCX7608409.1 4Fe-4S dicluster domain-containing protein [Anaerolineales bacterium]MDW8228039.1 4Fe-4S dicluster domain-containing protein [Anaerolineales bacterium]
MPAKGWIQVNDLYCKGCELCVAACPPKVLALNMERLTPKGYHPVHIVKDGCTGCAICALVCPDAAITVYREVTKAAVPVAAGG